MFNNNAFDVVIGLIFIYLLYSLLATAMQEAISTIFQRRSAMLYQGIKSMLTNSSKTYGSFTAIITILRNIVLFFWKLILFARNYQRGTPKKIKPNLPKKSTLHGRFYNHPIIKNYGQNLLFKKPSYLSAENFSSIIIETIKDLDSANLNATATFSMIKTAVQNNSTRIDAETASILNYHLNEAAGDLDVFKHRLQKWYNDSMDRVSGWYKRNTQFWLFGIAIWLGVTLNIDSIEITNYLSENRSAREQLARMGEAAAGNPMFTPGDSAIAKEALDSVKASINRVNTLIGLGWGDYGASDPRFMERTFKGEKDSSDIKKAFNAFDSAAIAYWDTLKSNAGRAIFYPKDSVANAMARLRLTDSLTKNQEAIINQQKFSLLYTLEEYNDSLRRQYVWYRLWNWRKIFGFLITALAIGLGAPFWFDLLNKFVSLRTAVKAVGSSGSTTKNNAAKNNPDIDG
jgi:hypothetical protein